MRLKFNVSGAGRDLILLHGLFGSASNLGGLARDLLANYRVWSPDLRNHGSSGHSSQMGYRQMATDVLELMDGQSIARAAVLGHSMGGKVAMLMALTAAERVAGLAVLDIAPVEYLHDHKGLIKAMLGLDLPSPGSRAELDRRLEKSIPDRATRTFLLQNLRRTAASYQWRLNLPVLLDASAVIQGFPDDLPNNRYLGPTVFIHGLDSDYVVPGYHPIIHELFSNVEIVSLAEAGHWLHVEQPEQVLDSVHAWLNQLWL